MEIRQSAYKHVVTKAAVAHAVEHWLLWNDDVDGSEPPKILVLGPDRAGNIPEILAVADIEGVRVVFHAMPARAGFLKLLATPLRPRPRRMRERE